MRRQPVREEDNGAVDDLREGYLFLPPSSPAFPGEGMLALPFTLHRRPPFHREPAVLNSRCIAHACQSTTQPHGEVVIMTGAAEDKIPE
jgi:hypothetical protein